MSAMQTRGCKPPANSLVIVMFLQVLPLAVIVQVGGIIVDVNLSEHSATIRFSDYHDGAAPFLIINHTKDQALLFHQR